METLSIKVPSEVKARLRAAAKQRHTKPSALLRQALEKVLEAPTDGQSLYDRSKEILESGDTGGPRDLSTNPKYLKNWRR